MNAFKDIDMEIIVKHVLFRLGEIEKVVLLESLSYESDLIDDFETCSLITWVSDAKAVHVESKTKVFLPHLSCKALMETFLGIGGQPVSDELLSLLLKGVPVHVKASSVELLTIGTPKMPLLQKYHEALNVLTESGLVIEEQHEDKSISGCQSSETHCQKKVLKHSRKLLNEQDIKAYEKMNAMSIQVHQFAIITPLAQDYLRQSQLKVVRE